MSDGNPCITWKQLNWFNGDDFFRPYALPKSGHCLTRLHWLLYASFVRKTPISPFLKLSSVTLQNLQGFWEMKDSLNPPKLWAAKLSQQVTRIEPLNTRCWPSFSILKPSVSSIFTSSRRGSSIFACPYSFTNLLLHKATRKIDLFCDRNLGLIFPKVI